jgi:shikimate kinase
MARPLVLIGFMATGKSTVGPILAQRLGRRFLDLDALVAEEAGMTIPQLFAAEGEAGFRARESRALGRALEASDLVLATGGGAACREDNLALLLDRASVVSLEAPPEEILRRTGGGSGRPLLDGATDPLSRVRELLALREPFYARAHARVRTVGKSPEAVAQEIIEGVALDKEART